MVRMPRTPSVLSTFLMTFALAASAQQTPPATPQPPPAPEQRRERGPGSAGVGGGGMGAMMMLMGGGHTGQVTAIAGDSITIKTQLGAEATIKTDADTRVFSRERTPIALKDLKVGDWMLSGGATPDGVARFVAQLDENAVARIKEFQANLGKTVIAGEIKAIDDTKLTIARPDGVTQQIELDESSSLKRGRDESITLADVKVGDRVFGQGELKNGVFVPRELRVMTPGTRRGLPPTGAPAGGLQGMPAPPPTPEPAPTPAAPPPPK
jgi:preprotein translocase subunit YajC